jgi:hypothetical protein
MSRAYLRLDPGFYDRKVIDQKYPPGAAMALIGALCHAEHQPARGRFRDARVLRSLLGPLAKWIPYLIEHRDLLVRKGQLYIDGWDEWQEGDWKVGERVKRIRNRQKAEPAPPAEAPAVTPDVTVDVTPDVTVGTESPVTDETVYNLSDGGRQSVIDGGGVSGKRVASGDSPPRAKVNRSATLLTKQQLSAWATFGPEWAEFKAAWLERGLRHPPSGAADDETSQRAMLWEILEARPNDLVRWIREAPKKAAAADVVGYALARWKAIKAEAGIQEVDEDDLPIWLRKGPEGRAEAAAMYADLERRAGTS